MGAVPEHAQHARRSSARSCISRHLCPLPPRRPCSPPFPEPHTHQVVTASTTSGTACSASAAAGAPTAQEEQKVAAVRSSMHTESMRHSQAVQAPHMSRVPNQCALH